MAKRATNLVRRNGTYYFRCRVPDNLRPAVGKREIIISLRTKDYAEGRTLVAGIRYAVLLRFAGMKKSKDPLAMKLDLSTDLTLPKSLGGDADPPIKEHRINLREVAKVWANEADEAKDALVKVVNGAGFQSQNNTAKSFESLNPESKKHFYAFTEQFMERKRVGEKARVNLRTAYKNLRHIAFALTGGVFR